MILNVAFEQTSVELPIIFDSDDDMEIDFGETTEISPKDLPQYDGEYEVNPTFSDQILNTAGCMVAEDIKIEQIPLAVVSNNSGGMTVIIGG